MNPVEVQPGTSPVILAFPHPGTEVPPAIWARLNDRGCLLADTDWHLHRLYEGLLPHATTVRATFHRYVVDANRDPAGGSLYPGQNTTDLIPTTDFDGQPIWLPGQEPTDTDLAARTAAFHAPYHAALAAEISRVKSLHGSAVVFDCHSIRSHIPFLFDGTLPDFNVGTGQQRRAFIVAPGRWESAPGTCCDELETTAIETVRAAADFTSVLNGRFKGGWTVRHYSQSEPEVNAIQLELAQSTYLSTEAPPFAYDAAKAQRVRIHLKTLLERIEAIAFDL